MNNIINQAIALRKELHKNPELSGNEKNTAKRIINFIEQLKPDQVISKIGGEGIAFIFKFAEGGKTILFRSELDALPIQEINSFDYRSSQNNVSHKCGHDGHMAVLSGFASLLSEKKFNKGKVILLFQPAEETGEGAERILKDEKFKELNPDFVFAFHNLPGFKLSRIIIGNKNFASASKGMIVKLIGKTSHAAEPEKGISPVIAVSEIINSLSNLVNNIRSRLKDFCLVTIIHIKVGEKAFGTTPGYAEIMATLRSFRNDDMKVLSTQTEKMISQITGKNNLKYDISWTEEFPATVNSGNEVNIVEAAARENDFEIFHINSPFKWSEDFGHFTNKFKGCLFGIGSGENHPDLHNPDYDFPDEIIETGIKMFYSITKNTLS